METLIKQALADGVRMDGRQLNETRNMNLRFKQFFSAFSLNLFENVFSSSSHCDVSLGDTEVMARVTCESVAPFQDRPNEGFLHIVTNLNPIASADFEIGSKDPASMRVSSLVELAVRESGAVDLEALCISSGELVWKIHVEVSVLNNGGNLTDACSLAAIGALSRFKRPEVGFKKTFSEKAKLQIIPYEDAEPVPISIIHWPVCITFGLVADSGKIHILLDTTQEEDKILDGSICVVMNEHGEICAIEKQGWPPVNQEILNQCCRRAENIAKQRLSLLV